MESPREWTGVKGGSGLKMFEVFEEGMKVEKSALSGYVELSYLETSRSFFTAQFGLNRAL